MDLRKGRNSDRNASIRAGPVDSGKSIDTFEYRRRKTAEGDRRRYFEIARGSAMECAAIQDVLVVGKALDRDESRERKIELDRIAAMLSRLGGRGYCVKEDSASYGIGESDFDPDSDLDPNETKSQ